MTKNPEPTAPDGAESMRLARYLAMCGIAARRKAEELIQAGRVTVNGVTITTPAFNVTGGKDTVTFDGRAVEPPRNKTTVLLNKPPGYTCSAADEHADHLVGELLPDALGRLFTVGRLDRDSEGLLICTDDGELAQLLAHPRHEVSKTYRVRVRPHATQEILERMCAGIEDEGDLLRCSQARVWKRESQTDVLELILKEGKKREIRRLCRQCGLYILRLQRTRYGTLELGTLPEGAWRHLDPAEIETLRRNAKA
jgi:23S rRNA pseudouridine2605 synthase